MKYVQFKWLRLLHPANLARNPSDFSSSINYILDDIDAQNFLSMWHWFQNKSPTHSFAVYWDIRQVSRTMFFQWGINNHKALVRHASTVSACMWRTMYFHTQWLHLSNVLTGDVIDKLSIPWVSIQMKFQNSTSKEMTASTKHQQDKEKGHIPITICAI